MSKRRSRGAEMTVRFNANGQPLGGEMLSIKNFNIEWEFDEEMFGYIGEKTAHTDIFYNRVKFDGEIDVSDGVAMALNDLIINAQEQSLPPVEFTATVLLAWRTGQAPETRTALGLVLYMPSLSNGGFKDVMTAKIQGAASKFVRTNVSKDGRFI